jgi:thymidylate synthase (FAD)
MMSEPVFHEYMTVELLDSMGDDRSVADAARISTTKSADFYSVEKRDGDAGLINFLMKNRHGTPFEHNAFKFYVKAPIFVFREFHRHRIGFSYNEMSGRYTELLPEFYIPGSVRPLVQTGKPGHYSFEQGVGNQWADMHESMVKSYLVAWDEYRHMLAKGIAKEVARMVLPVGIFSQMIVTCNARSLMSFLSLRTKGDGATFPSYPQAEIEEVAEKMESLWEAKMPVTWEAFNNNGRVAP